MAGGTAGRTARRPRGCATSASRGTRSDRALTRTITEGRTAHSSPKRTTRSRDARGVTDRIPREPVQTTVPTPHQSRRGSSAAPRNATRGTGSDQLPDQPRWRTPMRRCRNPAAVSTTVGLRGCVRRIGNQRKPGRLSRHRHPVSTVVRVAQRCPALSVGHRHTDSAAACGNPAEDHPQALHRRHPPRPPKAHCPRPDPDGSAWPGRHPHVVDEPHVAVEHRGGQHGIALQRLDRLQGFGIDQLKVVDPRQR